MKTKDSQRKASMIYDRKMKDAGYVRINFWIKSGWKDKFRNLRETLRKDEKNS